MSYQPKYQRGDLVQIPDVHPGHDHHDPKRAYMVNKVYAGDSPRNTGYTIKGLTGLYPETRLKQG